MNRRIRKKKFKQELARQGLNFEQLEKSLGKTLSFLEAVILKTSTPEKEASGNQVDSDNM